MNRLLAVVVLSCSLWGVGTSCTADELTPVMPAEITPVLPPTTDLAQEPTLSTKVSFEAQRQALPALLSEVSRKSGVPLSAEEGLTRFLVTGRAVDISLHSLLDGVARLYGLVWEKRGDGYFCRTYGSSQATSIAQLGDLRQLEKRTLVRSRETRDEVDWIAETFKHADEESLRSPQGVKVSGLPLELRDKIRRTLEERAAWRLLKAYALAGEETFANSVITVSSSTITPSVAAPLSTQPLQNPLAAIPEAAETLSLLKDKMVTSGAKPTSVTVVSLRLATEDGLPLLSLRLVDNSTKAKGGAQD